MLEINRWSKVLPVLLLVAKLLPLVGCGHDAYFRGEGPPPLSADVIVVGDSIAGLAASLEAAQQGAAVLVFYEHPYTDGWIWDEGAVAVGPETEGAAEEAGEEDPADYKKGTEAVDRLRRELANFGGGGGQTWHFDLLASRSWSDLQWLVAETGVVLSYEPPFRYRPESLSLEQVREILIEKSMRHGARFFAGTTVEELIIDQRRNSVTGIRYIDSAGAYREAYAAAVILADGGNPEGDPAADGAAAPWRGGISGRGRALAEAAGLDLVDTDLFAYAPAVVENDKPVKAAWPEGTVLIVEERIIPLAGKTPLDVVNELLKAKDAAGYLLVAAAQPGGDGDPPWPRYAGVDSFMEAHSLDIPLLRRWFNRPWADFFGVPIVLIPEYRLGGIAVNRRGQVLRNGEPVRGLYAAGEITGGLFGQGLMPGAALTGDLVWGRETGRNAAAEALR